MKGKKTIRRAAVIIAEFLGCFNAHTVSTVMPLSLRIWTLIDGHAAQSTRMYSVSLIHVHVVG